MQRAVKDTIPGCKSFSFRGFTPQSFSDYEGKIAALLFTGGCNMRCRFCYNAPLVLNPEAQPPLSVREARESLSLREGFLDAVVITGGEPTIHPELPCVLEQLRDLPLLVGLDTNGTNPQMLRRITEEHLVDRIALDYKAPANKYEEVTGNAGAAPLVRESVSLAAQSGVEYEIRVTLHPELHPPEDVARLASELAGMGAGSNGSGRIALQSFMPWKVLDRRLEEMPGYPPEKLEKFKALFPGNAAVR